MIAKQRGEEPPELRAERRCRLARALLAKQAREPVEFIGYETAKDRLYDVLHGKCAFCEMPLRKQGNPVEHFRPKQSVKRASDCKPEDGYWWLAWTWENLLFACTRCNTHYKGTLFPLVPGSTSLPEMCFDLDQESPILIDPARLDPREHIRFGWVAHRKRWIPYPINGSELGDKTIKILGLDEDDRPTEHVRERVEPWLEQIKAIWSDTRGDVDKTSAAWRRMLDSLFAPRQPFHAVTWDALEHFLADAERHKIGLALPQLTRPCATGAPSFPFEDPPEFARLLQDETLRLRVRALGRWAREEELKPVLSDLLAYRPFTDHELSQLLGRQMQTIRRYREQMKPRPAD